ncbi:ATP-binding protein [Aquisphaera giovannonii]|uniref:ATP-binding protein n=1 Tax=Aquisphaera giovannonii TaxID=406548 RepID=UPI001AEFCCB9|nr:ATP-binding protein [Aquisphaera giovannonii]
MAAGGPSLAERFRSIVADTDEGVIILEPDGTISYTNAAAEFLLGCARSDLVGEMFGLPLAADGLRTVVDVVSDDGAPRVVELRIEPLPSGDGAAGGLVLRLRDVSDYHRDAAGARGEVRRKDEFLAMLSHELRNPLAAIRSAAHLLTRDDAGPAARREAARALDGQFRHLTRILDDLLDVSRISRGKLEVRMGRVDLCRVVRDAAAAVAPLAEARRQSLQLDVPDARLWAWGDPTRLEQAAANLLTNSVKFTPAGGRLEARVSGSGNEAELIVRDDGPGIPDDLLPHVFEPFVQGRQAVDRGQGGLGIGLALARTIVGLHGGSIQARPNDDGRGVTFAIRLPLLGVEVSPVEGDGVAAERGPAPPPLPLRILLVEDNDLVRGLLKEVLRLDGHEVSEASDGPAGLAALLDQKPDVALVDIGLPGFDGHELARRARGDERGREVRLVALTGYGMPEDVETARAAGFDVHVVKPLNYPDLCELLRGARTGPAGSGQPGDAEAACG